MKEAPSEKGNRWWWALPKELPFPFEDVVTVITITGDGRQESQSHSLSIATLERNVCTLLNNHQLDMLIMGLQKARLKAKQAIKEREIRESAK